MIKSTALVFTSGGPHDELPRVCIKHDVRWGGGGDNSAEGRLVYTALPCTPLIRTAYETRARGLLLGLRPTEHFEGGSLSQRVPFLGAIIELGGWRISRDINPTPDPLIREDEASEGVRGEGQESSLSTRERPAMTDDTDIHIILFVPLSAKGNISMRGRHAG